MDVKKSENKSGPWPYPGCGYEKDEHDQTLLRVLKMIMDKKQGEIEVEERRKEGKRDLLQIREG
jgi:hypothetical protein